MKMTYIVYIVSENDCCINFERFSCKRIETAKRNMLKLFECELYRICNKGAKKIKIYRTPDGYNREKKPVLIMDL